MAARLGRDPGTYIAYRAGVAMLLHDQYNITDFETRNRAAADILALVFGLQNLASLQAVLTGQVEEPPRA